MPSPLISLRSTAATRDVHIPHLGANHQVVRKSFSSWNHCSFVLPAPGNLTVSNDVSSQRPFCRSLFSHIRYKWKVDKVHRAVYANNIVIISSIVDKTVPERLAPDGAVGLGAWQRWRQRRFCVPLLRGRAAASRLARRAQAKREGWRSRLLGLSSPAHTPTRRSPHGLSKHKWNDRLGQSFLPGYSAPLDPLRRTEVVCGRFFCGTPWGF